MDIQAAKQAEEGDPKHEEDEAPYWHGGESEEERDQVEDSRYGR